MTENGEWMTVPKFAKQANVKEGTIRTYISMNAYGLGDDSKVDDGRRYIHKDALSRWQDEPKAEGM